MKPDAAPAQDWADARILVLSPAPTHPQDDGDRKRVFEICRRLSADKARITLVHYAVGRGSCGMLPWSSERAMAAAWAQYYAVAPSRPLRSRAATEHYQIDEWWDPAVGTFLDWLFSVQSFDVFIVNTGWLSKAFEFAPASVFKILETHGKLSGPPEVLEMLGSKTGFFHTIGPEQKIALDRADLVWAISDEERAEFDRMTTTPVLTMPHVDSSAAIARPAPDHDGYLRVGLVGACSDVDRINIKRFVEAAGPIFRETFAPIKLVIAGSVCSQLGRLDYPFVELWPAPETVEDFYGSVDCVAIPMEISAGPKVQTSEAIALEMPVVSTALAFEGYSRSGNTHGFATFGQMAKALSDLAFAPRTELDVLAAASRSARARAGAQAEKAFRHSATLMRKGRRMIVLAVDSRAFVPGSVFNLALFSIYDRLRFLANITVLVAAGSAKDVVRNPAVVNRFHRVVVGRDIADANGLRDRLAALGADIREIGDLLRMAAPRILIADALNPAMFTGSFPDTVVVARTEMIAFSEGGTAFALPGGRYRRAFASAPAQSQQLAERLVASGAEPLLEPCLWPSVFDSSLAHGRERERAVALLGTPRASAMAIAARMAQSWKLKPVIVYGIGESVPARLDGISCVRADAYVAWILKGATPIPQFAVDLSAGAVGLPLCREVLERLHVPTVSTSPAGCAGSNHDMLPLLARTEGELWSVFRSFATQPYDTHERNFAAVWHDLDAAHGWTWLRRYCTLVFEVKTAEFA